MFLVHSAQDLCDLLAGLYGFLTGFEAVAEVPSLVIKIRITPGKEFNHAIAQNEIVVIAVAWLPALGFAGGLSSTSRHGSTAPYSIHSRTGNISNAECFLLSRAYASSSIDRFLYFSIPEDIDAEQEQQ